MVANIKHLVTLSGISPVRIIVQTDIGAPAWPWRDARRRTLQTRMDNFSVQYCTWKLGLQHNWQDFPATASGDVDVAIHPVWLLEQVLLLLNLGTRDTWPRCMRRICSSSSMRSCRLWLG